jgi:hypothetical protein
MKQLRIIRFENVNKTIVYNGVAACRSGEIRNLDFLDTTKLLTERERDFTT